MTAYFKKADDEVIQLTQELIDQYHPWLKQYSVGVIFRSERQVSGGRDILGEASKVNDKTNALLPDDQRLDFLIWLAEDFWHDATDIERRALLDHELCHCGENGKMRHHDVQEFVCIIERYGLWYPALRQMAHAAQQHTLPGILEESRRGGKVISVNLAQVPA